MINERLCFPYKDDRKMLPEFVNSIIQIYNKIVDEESKDIFINRLLFSITGNHKYITNILLQTNGGKRISKLFDESERPIYIYGAGIRGKRLIELFPNSNWGGYIDANSSLTSYQGLKVLTLEQFMSYYVPGTIVVISNMAEIQKILDCLIKCNIKPEDIYILNNFDEENAKNIYFLPDCIEKKKKKEKGFVDIGCYDGKDSLGYMERINNSNVKIYAFEPDINNYRVCKRNLGKYHNIELFNLALSDVENEIGIMEAGEMSCLSESGVLKVKAQLLDNIIQDKQIGYIKMDVEGYEKNVIKGAKKVISSQQPIMAVSIYHKKSDIWEIPELLLQYNEHYCFYLRHYSASNGDTVLYAVDDRM